MRVRVRPATGHRGQARAPFATSEPAAARFAGAAGEEGERIASRLHIGAGGMVTADRKHRMKYCWY